MAQKLDILTETRKEMRKLLRALTRQPEVGIATKPVRSYRPLPPAPPPIRRYHGGKVRRRVVYPGLLTFIMDGVIVIQGTELAGINFADDDGDIITGGTGTVTVEDA